MADLAKLVDELSALTVMEAADLSKMLEEKWGVSAAAAVAVAAGGAAAGAAARPCRADRPRAACTALPEALPRAAALPAGTGRPHPANQGGCRKQPLGQRRVCRRTGGGACAGGAAWIT